ncbi:hypothetical protein ASZ90_012321 [hydrocarbon metagenome]|uniref:Uncharacterized protein n=2 Tax=root TaxID=1 RepID=A0A0W8FAX6_9ZZZZ
MILHNFHGMNFVALLHANIFEDQLAILFNLYVDPKLKLQARLEDISVQQMKKDKKGELRSIPNGWPPGVRAETRNVRLGSCAKMDQEIAIEEARKIKADLCIPHKAPLSLLLPI